MTKRKLSDRIKSLPGWKIEKISDHEWHVFAPGHPDDPFIYKNGEWVNEEFENELVDLVCEYEGMHSTISAHYGC